MNAHTTRFLSRSCNDLAQCTLNSSLLTGSSVKACKNKQFHDSFYPGLRFWNYKRRFIVRPHRHKAPTARPPQCSTQRGGIAPPRAEGEGLSGVTSVLA